MGSREPNTVLITGASSGIGKATALYLARRGHRVVATSRELSRVNELSEQPQSGSAAILTYQLDINEPTSVEEVVPRIISQAGGLDALINNAGYGLWGCLEQLTVEEVKAQFETNLFAVLRMSQAVLPSMRERGGGTIVNVGSVAGQISSPAGGAYSASKFALESLTKVMRMEAAQFGIRVVLIAPGLFRTNFHHGRVLGEGVFDSGSPYHSYIQRIWGNAGKNQRWGGDPNKVAKTIEKVLVAKHPRARYAVGPDSRLGAMAVRLLPDGLLEYLVKRVVVR